MKIYFNGIAFYMVTSLYIAVNKSKAFTGLAILENDPYGKKSKSCVMERVQYTRMVGYDCSRLDLREIPQHLKSSMEVLDGTSNRIRDLSAQSFARYTDLTLLYLHDNMIQNVEPDTFAALVKLQAVDLSLNALTTIPNELLQLPYLRNLYIYSNKLFYLEADLENVPKPIKAPLEQLNIADTGLTKIPNFGPLPELWSLNISLNNFMDMRLEDMAILCNLQKIDINYTQMENCICQDFLTYAHVRKITINLGTYCNVFGTGIGCPESQTNFTIIDEDPERIQCVSMQKVKQLQHKSKITWLSIAICIAGFLILFISILYYLHRRSMNRLREIKIVEKLKKISDDEIGNSDGLLSEGKVS